MHHTSISARACQPGGYFTLKSRILLENYFLPGDLEAQIEGLSSTTITSVATRAWTTWRPQMPVSAGRRPSSTARRIKRPTI